MALPRPLYACAEAKLMGKTQLPSQATSGRANICFQVLWLMRLKGLLGQGGFIHLFICFSLVPKTVPDTHKVCKTHPDAEIDGRLQSSSP